MPTNNWKLSFFLIHHEGQSRSPCRIEVSIKCVYCHKLVNERNCRTHLIIVQIIRANITILSIIQVKAILSQTGEWAQTVTNWWKRATDKWISYLQWIRILKYSYVLLMVDYGNGKVCKVDLKVNAVCFVTRS